MPAAVAIAVQRQRRPSRASDDPLRANQEDRHQPGRDRRVIEPPEVQRRVGVVCRDQQLQAMQHRQAAGPGGQLESRGYVEERQKQGCRLPPAAARQKVAHVQRITEKQDRQRHRLPDEVRQLHAQPEAPEQPRDQIHRVQIIVCRGGNLPQVRRKQMTTLVADPRQILHLVEGVRAACTGQCPSVPQHVDHQERQRQEGPDREHGQHRGLGADQLAARLEHPWLGQVRDPTLADRVRARAQQERC